MRRHPKKNQLFVTCFEFLKDKNGGKRPVFFGRFRIKDYVTNIKNFRLVCSIPYVTNLSKRKIDKRENSEYYSKRREQAFK